MKKYDVNNHPSKESLIRVRENMAKNQLDWLIVFMADPHLSEFISSCDAVVEEISGFSGSNGTLLISDNECFLWTDSRYFIQAKAELEGSEIILMKDGEENVPSLPEFLENHIWEGHRIGFDFKCISCLKYKKIIDLCPESVEIEDAGKVIRDSRKEKSPRSFHKISNVIDSSAGMGIPEKLESIRKNIRKKYVKDDEKSYSYIISDLSSVMWIFNLRGSDIDYVPVAYSYAVINNYSATLYVCRKYLSDEARIKLNSASVITKEYSSFYGDLQEIASDCVLLDRSTSNSAIDSAVSEISDVIYSSDYEIIRKFIKNSVEIEGMKKAGIKDGVVMCRFIKMVKEMASENSLTDEYSVGKKLDEMRLNSSACALSFETICAYGPNAAIVHYEANEDVHSDIKPSGFLLVDSGGQYEFEGTTDITRTICLGELSNEEKTAYTAVLKGNLRLMNLVFPHELRGENIDVIAKMPIWSAGYDFYHGTGHGIGCFLEVHESPVCIKSSISRERIISPVFEEGMILSDEPGIYVEEKFGVRLENAILVVDKSEKGRKMLGFEPISYAPFDLDAVNISEMSPKDILMLNNYHKTVYDVISPHLNEDEKIWLQNATKSI